MTATCNGIVTTALGYAARGWPVFPCQPGGKEPATRHGFRDASTDPAQIRRWWHRQPAANLAIATGAPGPDVLDVDHHGPAGDGFTAWHQLKTAGLVRGTTVLVATPSGGLHAYFTGTSQACGRLPGRHLDFKSAGGYILAPPSRIAGNPYRLLTEGRAGGGVLDWADVTALLDPRPEPRERSLPMQADPARLAAWVERLQEGNRNNGLFWAACRAIETGQPGILTDLAAAAATTGLPDREIQRTIASARRSAGS
jgi:hypothetical protein